MYRSTYAGFHAKTCLHLFAPLKSASWFYVPTVMSDSCGRPETSKCSCEISTDSPKTIAGPVSSEAGPSSHKLNNSSLWSGYLVSGFSVFETCSASKGSNKFSNTKSYSWATTLKRVMNSGSMRRILGWDKIVSNSKSDIWLLGLCYKFSHDDSSDPRQSQEYASFLDDFSSRLLMTYRKGFSPIEDTKYSSDVNWGCMLRSSQMLVAQAFIFHILGRSWRKTVEKPLEQNYVDILKLFIDSESAPYSIHNLLQAGTAYGLSPGSWVGPYAMCRTWETLARTERKESLNKELKPSITIVVVSGDDNGERGGAPVVCVEDITRHGFEFSNGQCDWVPTVLLVPLVLGLDKVNPRYIPMLEATFCFPQSLGILGGKPGASTYIIGVQDDMAFYLDPHDVQQVVDINKDDLGADTSTYHTNTVRNFPLESLDPSLAIGFYCRDKSDFVDFCFRASELAEQSNGAPLFTVTQTKNASHDVGQYKDDVSNGLGFPEPDSYEVVVSGEMCGCSQEDDDWQLL